MSKIDYYPTLDAKADFCRRDAVEFQYSCIENASQFRNWNQAISDRIAKEKANPDWDGLQRYLHAQHGIG